jgi:hypothetical protein
MKIASKLGVDHLPGNLVIRKGSSTLFAPIG